MESGERPIVYQLVTNILQFMMSTRVKEWLTKFASSQTHIGFFFYQGVDNVLVNIDQEAPNFNTISAIDDDDYYHILRNGYEEALHVLVAFKDEILNMVRGNTYYTLVPLITPPEYNPHHGLFYPKRLQENSYSQEATASSSVISGD